MSVFLGTQQEDSECFLVAKKSFIHDRNALVNPFTQILGDFLMEVETFLATGQEGDKQPSHPSVWEAETGRQYYRHQVSLAYHTASFEPARAVQ